VGDGSDVESPRRTPGSKSALISFVRRGDLPWLLAAARPDREGEGQFERGVSGAAREAGELERGVSGAAREAGELDRGVSDAAREVGEFERGLSGAARDVVELLDRRGALFFSDLCAAARRVPSEIEAALWELVAAGDVTGDAVQNLRVLQSPALRRRQRLLQRGGPGRWSRLRADGVVSGESFAIEMGRLLLNRYGIVFRDLVIREAMCPPWRELVRVFRTLEARGEVRGGRFLAGSAGEQFGLPEAVQMARAIRKAPLTHETIDLAAVDPLNLTGIVTPGVRVPSIPGRWLRYTDGVPQGECPAPRRGLVRGD
jgi:hypothetical protein